MYVKSHTEKQLDEALQSLENAIKRAREALKDAGEVGAASEESYTYVALLFSTGSAMLDLNCHATYVEGLAKVMADQFYNSGTDVQKRVNEITSARINKS